MAPCTTESPSPVTTRLTALAHGPGRVSIGEITDAAGTDGPALLLVVFALAALVPGTAPAFGLAICAVGLGLALGHGGMALPASLRRRALARDRLRALLRRALPPLRWLEGHARPRWAALAGRACVPLVGLMALVCGLLVVAPIPFGNLPPALATLGLGLGLAVRDGMLLACAGALFIAALAFDIFMVVLFWDLLAALVETVTGVVL